jgi:hypothetical protein
MRECEKFICRFLRLFQYGPEWETGYGCNHREKVYQNGFTHDETIGAKRDAHNQQKQDAPPALVPQSDIPHKTETKKNKHITNKIGSHLIKMSFNIRIRNAHHKYGIIQEVRTTMKGDE